MLCTIICIHPDTPSTHLPSFSTLYPYVPYNPTGKTYRASTVTGLLPAWAAGAVTDSTVNYSLKQAFAFTAPAGTKFLASGPELMNGRLAMIAMVSALGNEIVTGQSVGQQLAQSPAGVGVTALLVVLGTLSSYCANIEPPAAGPFVNTTELLNGRVAMIGVAILLTLENNNGHALLQFLHAASETSA
jgi:hypothetical protein